jgi:two-component system sensor histidine kinase KdpD
MGEAEERPDPDALLRRIQQAEARSRRAKLKIFFGFAPGVGKTYRMLQVARDLVIEQHLDVMVGVVETHKRSDTASLLLGLEILPRKKVEYRGHELEEFDLDAALARKPKLLLVDELAHTNAPGSRHAKRWQDVLELLEAGIDVFTTVNVQHVESLNDVVAQITHVRVRETVPDSILDRADEIEVVDLPPEDLLVRLREGKVYLADQAARAAENFFQRGKLLALRELALRRTADRVDAEMQAYREEHAIAETWPAGERILVCVSPSPASARLVRAARRMAAGLRAQWVAAYVEPTAMAPMSEPDRDRLDAHLRLVESLGGNVVRLTGARFGPALLEYARDHNVTRILVGKPTHPRLRDFIRGSVLDEIVRGSGDIDVHVISGDAEAAKPAVQRVKRVAQVAPSAFASAAALVALATGFAWLSRAFVALPDLVMLYLLVIMVVAIRFGRGPSVLASALSVAAYDFFFVDPIFTFAVSDVRHTLTFAMMFGVGLVISGLTLQIRRQERSAHDREARTAALYALSKQLTTALGETEAAAALAAYTADMFRAGTAVRLAGQGPSLREVAKAGAQLANDAAEDGVARWVLEHGRPAGLGTDTLPGARVTCVPLRSGDRVLGVLLLAPGTGRGLHVEEEDLLEAFAQQGALALERAHLAEDAKAAALRAKTEEMRSSLLSAVSHDLRTPLAVITGAATTLRDGGANVPLAQRVELIEGICDEAERLERLVRNLLDMTRVESGQLTLKREWVPLEELIGSALTRLEGKLKGRPVNTSLPGNLPLLSVDPVLFEQVFVNLLENAAKYTPPGSPLDIGARADQGMVQIDISDRGPGLPEGAGDKIFEKFYRGPKVGASGVGLGLPICRGIMEAHGGSLEAENRSGGGAVFRLTLPRTGDPPALLEETATAPAATDAGT